MSWTRCGCPTSDTRAMRRRLSQRSQLVRARTRAKNEIHAVLIRRLKGRPPVSDVVRRQRAARGWPSWSCPIDERETVDARACARSTSSTPRSRRSIARSPSRRWRGPETLRLMTVPGVNVITASDVHRRDRRHPTVSRQRASWSATSAWTRKVRQSGNGACPPRPDHQARRGRGPRTCSSKRPGVAVRQPGPLRAFYERVRARRGAQVAASRPPASSPCLFWCLLTREQDYAFGQPSLTRQEDPRARARRRRAPRKGKVRAGIRRAQRPRSATPNANSLAQAEAAYRRTDQRLESHRPEKSGRERDTGARI